MRDCYVIPATRFSRLSYVPTAESLGRPVYLGGTHLRHSLQDSKVWEGQAKACPRQPDVEVPQAGELHLG